MAYVKDKEFIFNKMHSNKLGYYKVLDSDGKSILDQQDDDEVTVDEAVNRLRVTLENLTGLITVILSEKSTRGKAAGGKLGDIRITIKLSEDGSGKSIAGTELKIDEIRASVAREYEAKMETQATKHAHELKLIEIQRNNEKMHAELLDQIKALKEKDSDLEKYIPYFAGLFTTPGAAPLAGIPQEPHLNGPGDADSVKQRMVNAINRLLKVDRDFISNLEALADLAEKSPMMYQMAVNKLKSI